MEQTRKGPEKESITPLVTEIGQKDKSRLWTDRQTDGKTQSHP